jgi:hypothetical protein
MSAINKRLVRLALAIGGELASHRGRTRLIDLPTGSWGRCVELVRRVRRAQLRGWHLAADELRTELGYTIPTLQSELAAIHQQLPRAIVVQRFPTTNDLYQDLLLLTEEFENVDYDCRARKLSVMTEPIVLEGIYLGPFEIELDWGRLCENDAPPYRVIAKDPHPAESRENVTHPHVLDEVLCEGEGRNAIRRALAQGRLLDFFTLVAGVLRSYNTESPFVDLTLWYGQVCSDCGAVVSDEDRYACRTCGETICEGCESLCTGCEESCCSGCITTCPGCSDGYCRGCLRRCDHCGASVCPKCLDDNERCPTCHEKEPNEGTDNFAAAPDRAAVQPHGLGQALVSA